MNVGSDGFVLTAKGEGDVRYKYLKTSSVEFLLNIPNGSHPIVQMINDLPTAPQGQYKILIEASTNDGVSYYTYWRGVLTSDIIERDDISYPYFLKLTAVDGLSLMKDTPFNKDIFNGVNDSVTQLRPIRFTLTQLLRYYNPTIDFFGAADNFLYEMTHWYEDSMPTPANSNSPLDYSAIYANAFMGLQFNEDGAVEETNPLSAYDALEAILKAFGCRLFQRNGYWMMVHIEMYNHLDGGELWYRRYNYEGNKIGNGTLTESSIATELGNVNDAYEAVKLSGGIYSFLPAFQEVQATYDNWTSQGLLGTEQELASFPGAVTASAVLQDLGFVVATAGGGINITHRIQYKKQTPSSVGTYDYLQVIYMLKVGSYYYDGSSWTLTLSTFSSSASFVSAYVESYYQDFGDYPQFSITTADFPTNGNVYFRAFKYEGSWGGNNGAVDYDMRILANTTANPSFVTFSLNGSTQVSRLFSSSDNTSTANEIDNLGNVYIGDGPTTSSPSWGRIRINNGSSWLNTVEEDWQAWGTGLESRITNILCNESFTGQREFLPLNNYNILFKNKSAASFSMFNCLDDNTSGGDRMVANGFKLIAAKSEISGEFWKASRDATGVTNNSIDTLTEAESEVGFSSTNF